MLSALLWDHGLLTQRYLKLNSFSMILTSPSLTTKKSTIFHKQAARHQPLTSRLSVTNLQIRQHG